MMVMLMMFPGLVIAILREEEFTEMDLFSLKESASIVRDDMKVRAYFPSVD
jgi:hypothetical protein